MGYAKYVGRVGALAVVLGVGSAVSQGAAVAWAGPTDSGNTSSTSSSDGTSPNQSAASEGTNETATDDTSPDAAGIGRGLVADGGTDTSPGGDTSSGARHTSGSTGSSTDLGNGVVVSTSGGAHTSTKDDDATPKKKARTSVSAPAKSTATGSVQRPPRSPPLTPCFRIHHPADRNGTGSASAPGPTPANLAPTTSIASDPTPAPVAAVQAAAASVVAAPTAVVAGVANALANLFGGGTDTPVESPLSWVVAAIARRQTGTNTVTAKP